MKARIGDQVYVGFEAIGFRIVGIVRLSNSGTDETKTTPTPTEKDRDEFIYAAKG